MNPSKYQLKIWRADEKLDYWQHISRNRMAFKNARESGLTDKQLMNLFMLTLRPQDVFIDEIIEDADREDFETFQESVGRYLSGSPATMMNHILKATRGAEETLMQFFIRLCEMYKTSTGKNPKSPEAISFLQPMVMNNCTRIQGVEMIRELESIGAKNITFEKLTNAIKKAQVMDNSNYADAPAELLYKLDTQQPAAEPKPRAVSWKNPMDATTGDERAPRRWERRDPQGPRDAQQQWNEVPRRPWASRNGRQGGRPFLNRRRNDQRDPLCFNCNGRGHRWRDNCPKPLQERFIRIQKREATMEAQPRENKTPPGTVKSEKASK